MTDKGKPISFNPDSFSDSPLLKVAYEYRLPDKDEPKSRFSVSGFPTKLLDIVRYAIPPQIPGSWRKTTANVERFLFSVGIPLLDDATSRCHLYSALMAEAVSSDNNVRHNELRARRFKYDIDDMRILGGREIGQGGTKLQCLNRDVLAMGDVAVRLAGFKLSPLVVLAVLWALSIDADHQIVPKAIQKMSQKVVDDFCRRLVEWDDDLRRLCD